MGIGIHEWGIDFMDRPLILTLVHVYTLCTLLLLRQAIFFLVFGRLIAL